MRVLLTLSLLVASLATASDRANAQSPLVGAWERFAMKDSTGAAVQDPPPAAFTIYSPDGFYSQIAIPTGRAKVDKPLSEYTKEELLSRFARSEARRGRYTVSGNTLTRTFVSTLNPNDEGRDPQVQRFRIEGGELVLTSTSPTNKSEVRWRRAK